MAIDICVAVAKYSHATGVTPDNTIPWTHIVASNVFLVLKGEDAHIPNGQLLLQVVQGNSALETVDIRELVDRAIEARHGSQQAGITPEIEQLPIFGIHKEVFLALRYRLPDNQARRVQFRLQSAQECSYLVNTLERRGMEFQQQRSRTGRPGSTRPETAVSDARPLTTPMYSAKGTFGAPSGPPKSNPFRLQPLEAGGLSSQTLGDSDQTANTSHTIARRPSLIPPISDTRQQTSVPVTASYTSTISADRTMLACKPSGSGTTSTWDGLSGGMAHDFDNATTSHSTSSPAKQDSTLSIGQTTSGDYSPADYSSGLYQPSAPASLRLPDTLQHEMPPRRELPFKRPDSHRSASSRPSTASKSVSHSIAADGSSESTVASAFTPARNVSATRPATASPLKRAISPSHTSPVKKVMTLETRPQSHTSPLHSVSSPRSTYMTASEGSFRRPSDLNELFRITKPLSERSANSNKVTRNDSTADAPCELETPPGTSSSSVKLNAHALSAFPNRVGGREVVSSPIKLNAQALSSSSSPSRVDGRDVALHINPHNHKRSISPTRPTEPLSRASSVVRGLNGSTESAALAEYAAQSREDRQTIMDEFMVSKLEDPNFAVLCEDLDSCWRRIALGL